MSMIEIMIALAILGLMLVILSNSYQTWSERYRAESEVKEIFADLMDARARAMQRNRAHFIALYGGGTQYDRYVVYEDTSPGPDGDGALDNTADNVVRQVRPRYPVVTSPTGMDQFRVNRDGTIERDDAIIRVPPPGAVIADYDCIAVGRTRIKMGRFEGGVCVAK